jgi:hypothetical protein
VRNKSQRRQPKTTDLSSLQHQRVETPDQASMSYIDPADSWNLVDLGRSQVREDDLDPLQHKQNFEILHSILRTDQSTLRKQAWIVNRMEDLL